MNEIPKALFDKKRYATFKHMYETYPDFIENMGRFLSAQGRYPYRCLVKTPVGVKKPTLYSSHDFFTLNEIFCRKDYKWHRRPSVILDIGSNIGLSALYFLTQNENNFCFLYEPNPTNLIRLRMNLSGLADRYELSDSAVGDSTGVVTFGVEPTGRYGGIGVKAFSEIEVKCVDINEAIEKVLNRKSKIDLIKIDTEGTEELLVKRIRPEFYSRIGTIYLEAKPKENLIPESFHQVQKGPICRLAGVSL